MALGQLVGWLASAALDKRMDSTNLLVDPSRCGIVVFSGTADRSVVVPHRLVLRPHSSHAQERRVTRCAGWRRRSPDRKRNSSDRTIRRYWKRRSRNWRHPRGSVHPGIDRRATFARHGRGLLHSRHTRISVKSLSLIFAKATNDRSTIGVPRSRTTSARI